MQDSSVSRSFPVTISLLPVSLSLVHIPRSRFIQLVHPIVRQILLPNPAFLNLTCNEIELTIFAEHHFLADFEYIARKDRQRHRSRSGSTSSRSTQPDAPLNVAVEVSYEKWNVLQIDSHSSGLDSAGARVHEISAPLAAAGISILYQSSYTSDFIFVKTSRLRETMKIFAAAGFDVFSSDTSAIPLSPSGLVSPSLGDFFNVPTLLDGVTELPACEQSSATPGLRRSPMRTSSLPPSSSDVRVLEPDLTCIGLSDDAADTWSLKIIKLFAYPELIRPHSGAFLSANSSPISSYYLHGPSSPVSTSEFSDEEEGYHSASQNDDIGDGRHIRSTSSSPVLAPRVSRSHSLESSVDSRRSRRSAIQLHRMATVTELTRLSGDSPPPSTSALKRFAVPFFSFTRTAEGSSLTAPTALLAALFPPSERHMVMRGNDLDDLETDDSAGASELHDSEVENDGKSSPMRCLQIDLRQFGLDKYGLVSRFSRILEENGVNHMYSSTFKTANLLVDRRHASRAKTLLRTMT
ncbi:hypothetical protein K488DRAFT_81723 [Vararia minispora EC-137]|uniref:Uncharacterized protein n=1 Tax=Vararia minispora EC-137 TaxID=1314806 RepID=A0ACB8QYU4_9AGAM|nr:hypothetical protein K488DRAFT_81723 [Vararia minispora EC-137]